jgi:hypothetical protein
MSKPGSVKIELVTPDGQVKVLKAKTSLLEGKPVQPPCFSALEHSAVVWLKKKKEHRFIHSAPVVSSVGCGCNIHSISCSLCTTLLFKIFFPGISTSRPSHGLMLTAAEIFEMFFFLVKNHDYGLCLKIVVLFMSICVCVSWQTCDEIHTSRNRMYTENLNI